MKPRQSKKRNYYVELIYLFYEYENYYPFAVFSLYRLKSVDWCITIGEMPSKPAFICEQELTAEAVCKKAVKALTKYLIKNCNYKQG